MNEPKIRFKGFQGEWETSIIGDMCSISTGKSNTQDKIEDGKYPFYVRSPFVERSNKFLFDEEAVLTVGDGVGTGKVFHYVNGKYDLHQRVYRMFDFCNIYVKYFYYYFSTKFYKRVMSMTAKSSVDSVRMDMIADMKIDYPSTAEQQSIASYFQHLDALIQLTTKKIESLKQVKAASLQSMFPQEGETTPRVRFKGFEGEWEKVKVRDIFYITRGYVLAMNLVSLTKNRINRYAVYSSQTKNNGLAGYYNNYLYEDSITWTTDGANAGDVNYRPGKFYCTNVCGVLISKEGYANKCIAECLNLVTKHYVSYVGNPKLMNNTMSEIDILIPPIQKEQQKISDYFTNLDRQISLHTQRLEKLKQIKAACLDKMFV